MSYNNIYITIEEGIAILVINRPKKLNALNRETLAEIHDAFNNLEQNSEVKIVILTGSGQKAFVAGADISEFSDFKVKEGQKLAKEGRSEERRVGKEWRSRGKR